MDVRIYKPSKNAMQSGRARTGLWHMEYEMTSPRRPENLMGWVASDDTLNQPPLKFETLEDAITFAKKNNLKYDVLPERKRKIVPKNYGDNFK